MAGHGSSGADAHLTGWQKTFNTVTPRGRLHCGYMSIGFWTTIFLVVKFWPSSKKTQPALQNK